MSTRTFKLISFTSLFFSVTLPVYLQEETEILHLYTYIDNIKVEQRQVFQAEDIQRSNTESLPSFLQSAGIQILSYGAYGLESKPSIRGFTDETIRVIIDGICVNNAQYGTFDFTSINLQDVERIEIVRGGFTEGISDEGAVGGAIYITTKKQTIGHHLNWNTCIKSFLNQNYPIDTISQHLGYSGQLSANNFLKVSAQATWAQNKYQFKNYRGNLSTRENSSTIDGNGDIRFSHYFKDGNSLSIAESFYAGNKECPGPENSTSPGVQKDYNNRFSVSLFQPAVISGLKMEHNLAWLSNNRIYEEKTDYSTHYVNTFTYASYFDFYKLDFFEQTAGFTFDAVHLNSTNDGIHNQFSGTIKETSTFNLGNNFNIVLPLSVKFCGANYEFIPKAGLKFNSSHIDISLNGYRMIQFPNMDDLYWDSNGFHGNPNLSAENGWGTEFTVNIHTFWLPLSFCTFINYYKNKIQWSNTSGKWQPENVASAFYLGFNLSSKKSFFNGFITIQGSAEYLYTELRDKSNKLTYKKKIMWTPDLVFSASITFNAKWFSLTFEDNYTGKRYTSNLNTNSMDPYSLLNANLTINANDHIKPYLRLDNILDVSYKAVDNYPMPGISTTIGLKATF